MPEVSEVDKLAAAVAPEAVEKVKELGGLNHVEIEEFYRGRAKREYAYYRRHGRNPENFDEVVVDEATQEDRDEEVKPMHLMMDELQQAMPRVQNAIFGVAGLGKSSIVKKFCKKHGIKCKNLRVSKTSPKGFKGHATKSPRR